MTRVLLGALKGAAIGGAIGYGAFAAKLGGGWNWMTYMVIGFVVGLLVGQPVWAHIAKRGATIWTPVIKGLVGVGLGAGIYALVGVVWGTFDIELLGESGRAHDFPFLLGGGIGALYGGFVEADDAPAAQPAKKQG